MAKNLMPGKLNRDSLVQYVENGKLRIAGAGVAGAGLVTAASAATVDLNGTIGPLIEAVSALIPSLMNLVLALIPLMIVLAVAKFFPQLFDTILGWIKI
jgi:hypothetical protein